MNTSWIDDVFSEWRTLPAVLVVVFVGFLLVMGVAALVAEPSDAPPLYETVEETDEPAAPDAPAQPEQESAPESAEDEPESGPETAAPTRADADELLRLVGRVPMEGRLLADEIVLIFDEVLDAEASGSPFVGADPDLAGLEAAYIKDNYVVLPDVAETPHLAHVLELSPELVSVSGRTLAAEDRTVRIQADAFRVVRMQALRVTPEQTVLGIMFNAPVEREDLARHLSAEDADGAPLEISVEPAELDRLVGEGFSGPEDRRVWPHRPVFRLVIDEPHGLPVTVSVDGALTDASGETAIAEPREIQYPDEPAFELVELEWGYFEPYYQQVRMVFSHPIDGSALRDHLEIRDAERDAPVDYYLDSDGETTLHYVGLQLEETDSANLEFRITPGLRAGEHRVLVADIARELSHAPQPLRVQYDWWDFWQRDELALNLSFNLPVRAAELSDHLTVSPEAEDLRVEARDGRQVSLYASWDAHQTYEITVTPGLGFGRDRTLEEAVHHRVRTSDIPPHLAFGQEGRYYFPRRAGLTLPLLARNLDTATLRLHRLFPGNIAVAMNDIRRGQGSHALINSWSQQIHEEELQLVHRPDRNTPTPIDLDELFPSDRRGVFTLEAITEEGPRDTKVLLWTDMGVLSHWQDDGLILFAHDLASLEPRDGAAVTVYSDRNQVLGEGETDEAGVAQFRDFDTSLGTPAVAVVEHGEDYTFLELEPRSEDILAFRDDMPGYGREDYDAFIYADRELYRPGEIVHLRWLVRTNYGDALPDVPLRVTVIRPNGRELLSEPTELSALGAAGLDLETDPAYATGEYEVRITVPGDDDPIGTYTFNLEDFVPHRIAPEVAIADDWWMAGERYDVRVHAEHLFGASAANRQAEAEVLLQRSDAWRPDGWDGFRFGNDSEFSTARVPLGGAVTDEEGDAMFSFLYQASADATSPLRAQALGRVFELGGRAVTGRDETFLFTSDTVPGVAVAQGPGGQGVTVTAAVAQPDGDPADLDAVEVTLERQAWNYHVRRYYSHHEPGWSEAFEPVETREVQLEEGRGSVGFNVTGYGYYRVRVHHPDTPLYSTKSFYSYGGRCEVVDPAEPGLVKLTRDQDRYRIGDLAEIRVEAPFDGHGVVVLQGEEIERMIPVTIEDGVGYARFQVRQAYYPNIWAVATVIHAIDVGRTEMYPFSSTARLNVPVRDERRELSVAFDDLPEALAPGSTTEVDVTVGAAFGMPGAVELTLAAVDEGIHSITGYVSPDPYGWLTRTRRPEGKLAHYYDRIAYDFDGPTPGGGVDLETRVDTIGDTWIQPVALWSGVVETDEFGRASIPLDIPDYTGQLRLAAVAASSTAVGGAEARVYVRAPYMLRTNQPRFLLPGDEFTSRATVFNTTDEPVTVTLAWETEGALEPVNASAELVIPAGSEGTADAQLAAANERGQGAVAWEALIFNEDGDYLESVESTVDIPVRHPAVYQSEYDLAILAPGETRSFSPDAFLDDEHSAVEIAVSAQPVLKLQRALEYAVGYPYGCVEQQVSRLLPLYLLRQHQGLTDAALEDEDEPLDVYLQAGVNRLFASQTPGGGLAFWPGSYEAHDYASVYALHFLTLARSDEELRVPEEGFAALQDYVRNLALGETGGQARRQLETAYALYVLALDGDAAALRQIERLGDERLPLAARYLLGAAIAGATGDYDRARLFAGEGETFVHDVRELGGAFNSAVRNQAMRLMALAEMDGDANEMREIADELTAFLADRGRGNTQESAFVITALSRYLDRFAEDTAAASARVTGPEGGETAVEGNALFRDGHIGGHGTFTVENTGETEVYVQAVTRGIPEAGTLRPIADGIEIARTYYDARGEPVADARFDHIQSYVVGVTLSCGEPLENVVVSDILPAGFEIENPRLDPSVLEGRGLEDMTEPSHLEIRDDRLIAAFDELSSGEHRFYYVVQAVTPGAFEQPAIAGEAMYDDTIRGRGEGRRVVVEE